MAAETYVSQCISKTEDALSTIESAVLSALWSMPANPDILSEAVVNLANLNFTMPNIPDDFNMPTPPVVDIEPDIYTFTVPAMNALQPNTDGILNDMRSSSAYRGNIGDPNRRYMWEGDNVFLRNIMLKITDALTNGGVGISQALQDSIFNQDRERKLQALNDGLTRLNAGMGARGFRLPNSMLAGQRNELLQKHQFDLENQSREITKLMEEHARLNWQFCVQNGVTIEQFQADFTHKYDQLRIEMIKAELDKFKTMIEAELAAVKAEAEGYITWAQLLRTRIDADKAELDAEVSKMQAETQVYSATMGAYGTWISAQKAKIEASSINADAQIKEAALKVQARTAEVNALVNSEGHVIADRVGAYNSYAHMAAGYSQIASAGTLNTAKQ